CFLRKEDEYLMSTTILHLLYKLTFGGTERVIVNLANNSHRDVDNIICSFTDCDEDFLKELSGTKRVVFSLHKKEGNDFSIPFKIASFCRHHDVDIIHSLGWATYAEGLFAARISGKKCKFIHSFRGKTIEDTINIPQRRILAQHFFSNFCDAIITPSEESRKEYSRLINIDPEKIRVIYNGVDINRFQIDNSDSLKENMNEFGLKKEDIVIGSAARFDPVKNIDALVRAFARLPKSILEKCKMLLLGDGPELPFVRNTAKDLGVKEKVIFPGMRSDIPKCLSLVDIYVQPSKFEGVPNAVLEAMAAGLPVIATNVGGVPEIVEDGRTGILVEVDDETTLAQSIDLLIEDSGKRRKMGLFGRKRVVFRFSIQKMVSEYEKLYEQIMQLDSGTCPKG
ncbi:glycosyltransferase, partial [bacterium]|nr:glycosyltransferase [bacterium]